MGESDISLAAYWEDYAESLGTALEQRTAELARLRKALERIAELAYPNTGLSRLARIGEEARTALTSDSVV